MPDHHCRVCHQLLTLDTIYPSNHKKHDWICKTCDNDRRQSRRKRNNMPPEYDPKDVAFKSAIVSNTHSPEYIDTSSKMKSSSCSNFIKPSKPIEIQYCQLCQSYDEQSGTCHFNPPPWPRVYKDDWCSRFAPLT